MSLHYILIYSAGWFSSAIVLMALNRWHNDAVIAATLRAAANFCSALPDATGKDLSKGLNKQADRIEGQE